MSLEFVIGQKVSFVPGPKWIGGPITATIVAIDGHFLVTKDMEGKGRRMRKGACKAVCKAV